MSTTIHYKKPAEPKTLIEKSVSKADDGLVTVNATFLLTKDISLLGQPLDQIPGVSEVIVASETLQKTGGLMYSRVTGYGVEEPNNITVVSSKDVRSFSSELTRQDGSVITFSFDYLAETISVKKYVVVDNMAQIASGVANPDDIGPLPSTPRVFNRRGRGFVRRGITIVGDSTEPSYAYDLTNTIVANPTVLLSQSVDQKSQRLALVTITKQFLYQ